MEPPSRSLAKRRIFLVVSDSYLGWAFSSDLNFRCLALPRLVLEVVQSVQSTTSLNHPSSKLIVLLSTLSDLNGPLQPLHHLQQQGNTAKCPTNALSRAPSSLPSISALSSSRQEDQHPPTQKHLDNHHKHSQHSSNSKYNTHGKRSPSGSP